MGWCKQDLLESRLYQSCWCWDKNIPELVQFHDCWCPGSLHHQFISSHSIECQEFQLPVTSQWRHDDVIKWKHFPRYWPFVRGIHRSLVNSTHKGQWRRALMFSLICAWINSQENNREAGDLRRHHAHYEITVMEMIGNATCFHDYAQTTQHTEDYPIIIMIM